jgi:Holliday junction resolvase RusA-like endonuclease
MTFTVFGIARPKGSTRPLPTGRAIAAFKKGQALVIRSMRELLSCIVITSDSDTNRDWRNAVSQAARVAMAQAGARSIEGPVAISVTFCLPRPKRLKGHMEPHITRPDLDKLLRSCCDAMSGILFADDAQVVFVTMSKQYAEVGAQPRAVVTVTDAKTYQSDSLLDISELVGNEVHA